MSLFDEFPLFLKVKNHVCVQKLNGTFDKTNYHESTAHPL